MNPVKRPLVVIATPCFGGQVHIGYMNSVLRLMAAVGDRIGLSITQLGGDALISRARAMLVANFLDNPEATHLLFVDADISFEPAQFERLFARDKDFTAAMYPVKKINWSKMALHLSQGEPAATAGLDYVGALCTGDALQVEEQFATALYAGTGFMLLKRQVLERLAAAHPGLAFSGIQGTLRKSGSGSNQFALFDPLVDPASGDYLSEDFAFCRRWRALGGTIWLDLRSAITHTGSADFAGDTGLRHFARPEQGN